MLRLRLPLMEIADEKLFPGVRRSPNHVETQLRKPAGGEPFSARLNRGPPDTGGADNVARNAVGRSERLSLAPVSGRCSIQAADREGAVWSRERMDALYEKAGPVSAYARGGPAWICVSR